MKKFIALSAALLFLCSAPTTVNGAQGNATSSSSCNYYGCNGWVSICGDGVRIRKAPSSKAKVIGKANWYSQFPCLDIVNGFYKIKYKGKIAYVSTQYSTHERIE
ncbi:MAG: SH3 domain-containing protein [Muribaculaceae bacterium]|nr:SH3 domain-containing protein [Muribaculaceae bacterium]